MSISPVSGGTGSSDYAEQLRAKIAANAQTSASAVDADRDHDGDTSDNGRVDTKA